MRTISIFTPNHHQQTDFLKAAYDSLRTQELPEGWRWEWVVVPNNGAPQIDFSDDRVKLFPVGVVPDWVGYLKSLACERCTGEILVELDSDDRLLPGALAETIKAFDDAEVGFAYSNTVHACYIPEKNAWCKIQRFSEAFGWKFREFTYPCEQNGCRIAPPEGTAFDEHISFPPMPDSVCRIWFAPNHLRAWRTSTYRQVGGHNRQQRTLDDSDLMCRTYLACKFHHIDKPLYLYVVHGKNTWLDPSVNPEIQANVYKIYDQYIERLVERWAERNSLRKIELGARFAARPGYETVDLKNAEICTDLNERWPFKESSVGAVRAYDIIEHLRHPLHVMKELYRVLAPGGWAFIQVPSTDGRGAFQDPTHKSFWNENSFHYYTQARLAQYIDTPVRFQAPRLYTTTKDQEQNCWVIAHLVSLKNGYRPAGAVEI